MFSCHTHGWLSLTHMCPTCSSLQVSVSSGTDFKIDAKPWSPPKEEPDLEKLVANALKNHENTFLKLRISELEDQLKQIFEKIDQFAGRPTKDGAKNLKDFANKIRGIK